MPNYMHNNKFKLITKLSKINFIALGGIDDFNIKFLKLINVVGYAGISVFKKKGPWNRGPFYKLYLILN